MKADPMRFELTTYSLGGFGETIGLVALSRLGYGSTRIRNQCFLFKLSCSNSIHP